MDLGIDGNAAFVTGGTAGLGLASAKALAAEGADVAVCGRTEDQLHDAETTLESVGFGDVLALRADVTEREEILAAVTETAETFGGLDHLVTSGGGPPPRSFLETTEEEWYDAYDLLVMSVVRTVKAAHPHLVDGGGSIVTITSRSDQAVIDGHVLSNAVRRSVGGLMKTLSRELAPDVRANAVLPGPNETDRVRSIAERATEGSDATSDEFVEGMIEDVPMERIGQPAEVGETVAWLSSERASYVTGRAIPVDGGAIKSF
ncbi:SDR family oxidoreductase [Natrarchaeobius sp. A-rgal3]|uniref:SDR family oxidoreductase n=1 Tax=Natrarchaeobius versutus TaxID=1679078 RepID=UPI00350F6B4D